MGVHDSTCWTMIQGAAQGDKTQRDQFARRYERVVRDFFSIALGGYNPCGGNR